jgi:hypothetical protein
MKRVDGPYKGSKQNGGRPIYVIKKNGGKKTTSTNKARLDYKRKTGKSLPRTTHVDHADNNKHNDSSSNLRAMSRKKNIGKENKRRVGKKA